MPFIHTLVCATLLWIEMKKKRHTRIRPQNTRHNFDARLHFPKRKMKKKEKNAEKKPNQVYLFNFIKSFEFYIITWGQEVGTCYSVQFSSVPCFSHSHSPIALQQQQTRERPENNNNALQGIQTFYLKMNKTKFFLLCFSCVNSALSRN